MQFCVCINIKKNQIPNSKNEIYNVQIVLTMLWQYVMMDTWFKISLLLPIYNNANCSYRYWAEMFSYELLVLEHVLLDMST